MNGRGVGSEIDPNSAGVLRERYISSAESTLGGDKLAEAESRGGAVWITYFGIFPLTLRTALSLDTAVTVGSVLEKLSDPSPVLPGTTRVPGSHGFSVHKSADRSCYCFEARDRPDR
jgi:hypothetical protein